MIGTLLYLVIFIFGFCSEKIVTEDIPANMEAIASEKRRELIEAVSEVDDKLAEAFLNDEPISSAELEVCTQLFNVVYKEITTFLWGAFELLL